jgi:hypothetical protein
MGLQAHATAPATKIILEYVFMALDFVCNLTHGVKSRIFVLGLLCSHQVSNLVAFWVLDFFGLGLLNLS